MGRPPPRSPKKKASRVLGAQSGAQGRDIFCRNCGEASNELETFCSTCGTLVAPDEDE